MHLTEPPTTAQTQPALARGERARLVALLRQALCAGPDLDPGDIADTLLDAHWRVTPDNPAAALAALDPDARHFITLLAEHGPCTCDDTLPCDAAGEDAGDSTCPLCVDLDPDAHCPAHHPQRYPVSPHPAVLLEALRAEHADFLADLRAALATPATSALLSA